MRPGALQSAVSAQRTRIDRLGDLSQLVKARLTFLVLVTTGVGFYLAGRNPIDLVSLIHTLIGTVLSAAGASALNQWWERDLDAQMLRTCDRPVPSGRMRPAHALILGIALAIAGVIYLAVRANLLAGMLAALTVVIYIFAYTPLKRLTTTNTLIGAIPGALPPLIGWAAADGRLDLAAWSLFAILFIWQMPHFFAIAWMCRADYTRAGFHMLSSDDETGLRTASQAVLFAMALLLIGAVPSFVGICGPGYLVTEIILSGLLVALAMQFHAHTTSANARRLFLGSIVYLPLLLTALTVSKT